MMITIYGLTDEHGQIRYVGQTTNPVNRFSAHRRGDMAKLFKITGMALLDTCNTHKQGNKREALWTKFFGFDTLLNKRLAGYREIPFYDVCIQSSVPKGYTLREGWERGCCIKHRNQYDQQERLRLIRLAREMGTPP